MKCSYFFAVIVLLCMSCHHDCATGEYMPAAPDYADPTMWYTQLNDTDGMGADVFYIVSTWEQDWTTDDGQTCHYADVWNPQHREHMTREISGVAEYMGEGNNFYSPFYRHMTIDIWETQDEQQIYEYTRPSMKDVCDAFDKFVADRQAGRPFVIAGFSQGGLAVVELLKHMDDDTYRDMAAAYVLGYKVTPEDVAECPRIKAAQRADDTGVTICYNTVKNVKYVAPVVAAPNVMCINPVNWSTDSVPAVLSDTITVTLSPKYKVLVVDGYDGAEYPPIRGFLNVGDIHGCEPWLYKDCLRSNIHLRTNKLNNAVIYPS